MTPKKTSKKIFFLTPKKKNFLTPKKIVFDTQIIFFSSFFQKKFFFDSYKNFLSLLKHFFHDIHLTPVQDQQFSIKEDCCRADAALYQNNLQTNHYIFI